VRGISIIILRILAEKKQGHSFWGS